MTIGKNMADELTRTDGREVRLEEDQDLHLPFLLPEDGYSCDTIRGVPTGLPEFIKPMTAAGVCLSFRISPMAACLMSAKTNVCGLSVR